MNSRILLTIGAMACSLVVPTLGQFSGSEGTQNPSINWGPGEVAQRATVGAMSRLAMVIDLFVETRGEPPLTLQIMLSDEEFFVDPRAHEDWLTDGWGRRIVYFSNGVDYCILSFGLDGTSNLGSTAPGGFSGTGDYDADIAIINGRWVASPLGLGR